MTVIAQGAEIRVSFPAGAGLTAAKYKFVKFDTGTLVLCDGATDVPAGVLQDNVAEGLQAEIVALGPTKISADAALAQGDIIGTSADGQADKKIPGTDTTEYIVGRTMEAAAAAGNIIQAFVNCVSPCRAA